jgi:hypothetical protein
VSGDGSLVTHCLLYDRFRRYVGDVVPAGHLLAFALIFFVLARLTEPAR